jgi:hypothetical protein
MTLARSLVEHRAAIQDVPVKIRMTLAGVTKRIAL